jgi:ABC-2 type transport system permease protein
MTTNTINLQLRQSYAFVARNFNLTKRYWGWEIVWLMYATTNSLAVTFIAVGSSQITGDTTIDIPFFTLYLLLGTLVWHYLSSMFNAVSEMISWERWEGTIEYTLMAPVHRWVHLIGQTLFALMYSFLTTMVIATITTLFFELDLSQSNVLGAILVLLSGSFSLIGIGIVASILPLMYPERGSQMTHIIQASFLLVSGVYYPISVLPEWMQFLSKLSPVTYVLNGIRAAIMDGVPTSDLFGYIVPLFLFAFITVPFGIWAFAQAEAYAKRTGRLKRVG